jgi:plastocyanin
VAHNVTFGTATGAPANVTNMAMGSVSRSFSSAGTFSYQCTNHQGMGGQVIVQ